MHVQGFFEQLGWESRSNIHTLQIGKKKKNNMYQYKITHSSSRIINVEQVPKPKNDILEKKIDKYALAKKQMKNVVLRYYDKLA